MINPGGKISHGVAALRGAGPMPFSGEETEAQSEPQVCDKGRVCDPASGGCAAAETGGGVMLPVQVYTHAPSMALWGCVHLPVHWNMCVHWHTYVHVCMHDLWLGCCV